MEEISEEPLLSTTSTRHWQENPSTEPDDQQEDNRPINGFRDLIKEFYAESKKLWYLAGPAIFASISQYCIGAITQVFAGHLGTTQLAAISVENSVIAAFSYGIMLGMGSALETLCGQAYGAGKLELLGLYLQKSWIILNVAALGLMFTFIFGSSLLKLLGETATISKAAGKFAILMIPQLFAYATMIPLTKFLQAQTRVLAISLIALTAVAAHSFLSWIMMVKLGWGMVGAAVALDGSWWFITMAQLVYVLSGPCGRAWSGFSCDAFQDLWGFFSISVTSAIMLCLEVWYTLALVLFAGYFENAEVSVDAFSICINILGWTNTVAMGLNVAISVRVSNELGRNRPSAARFSVIVLILTALLIGIICAIVLLITRSQYPAFFTNNTAVKELVEELTTLLAGSIIITNVQYAMSGVAYGAGWQNLVAYMNIGSYFIFGIPLSFVLGYKLNMGVKGIWYGMISGVSIQCCLLLLMVYKTNWSKEAFVAENRIKQMGKRNSSHEGWRKEAVDEPFNRSK